LCFVLAPPPPPPPPTPPDLIQYFIGTVGPTALRPSWSEQEPRGTRSPRGESQGPTRHHRASRLVRSPSRTRVVLSTTRTPAPWHGGRSAAANPSTDMRVPSTSAPDVSDVHGHSPRCSGKGVVPYHVGDSTGEPINVARAPPRETRPIRSPRLGPAASSRQSPCGPLNCVCVSPPFP
jgi:hypothetical protein